MRLKDAATALVPATTFAQYGGMGLVIVTKIITETATAPPGGNACQNPLLAEKTDRYKVEAELATNMQPAEEMVMVPSTSTTWTTTTTTVGLTTLTTTINTINARSTIMSLGCGCKIHEENGFIDCPSGISSLSGSCGFPAGFTSAKISTDRDNAAHTNTVGQSNLLGAKQTARPPEDPSRKESRAALEGGGKSGGFIDLCPYQYGSRFMVNSTPADTSAPTYSYQFNPSLLGKRGPFSIDEYGQLFDDSGRMGTFDSYSKFRLRSPVAFTYPSPATWSACGADQTLLFGNTDRFYQCGNVSFPAIWNNVPPGYTEVSAQEGYGLTTCVKIKLVWTQVPESELKKRQDYPYPDVTTWPPTDCLLPVRPPQPTRLAKRGLQDGVMGDGIPHVAYGSTTATFAFRQEVETEAPGEDGSPGSVYTISARTMVFKEEPAYVTSAAKHDKRQDDLYIVAPVRTKTTAKSQELQQHQPSTPNPSTDLHDSTPGPAGVATRGENLQDGGFINFPIRTDMTRKSLMVPGVMNPASTSTTDLNDRLPHPTDLLVRDGPSPIFLNTYTINGATVVQQVTITDSPSTGIPGFSWYLLKTWTNEPVTVTEGTFALERVMTFKIQGEEGEPTTLYATHTTSQTAWASIVTPTGLSDRLYAGNRNWPNSEPAPALECRQNANPCQMELGCGTATKTSTHTISAGYTVIGEMTYSLDARTATEVFYDNPEPGDGPGPTPRDISNSPSVLKLEAAYTVTGVSTICPTKTAQVSGAPLPTGGSTKVIDTHGSKQLIAATIGMAFFAVLAFLL